MAGIYFVGDREDFTLVRNDLLGGGVVSDNRRGSARLCLSRTEREALSTARHNRGIASRVAQRQLLIDAINRHFQTVLHSVISSKGVQIPVAHEHVGVRPELEAIAVVG